MYRRQTGRERGDACRPVRGPTTESIGTPVANPPADLFTVPVNTVLKSNYITARAASCQMLKQGSGVIMFLTRPQAATRLRVVTGDRLARQCRQRDRDTTVGPHDRDRRATPPSRAETWGRYRQVHQRDPRAGAAGEATDDSRQ